MIFIAKLLLGLLRGQNRQEFLPAANISSIPVSAKVSVACTLHFHRIWLPPLCKAHIIICDNYDKWSKLAMFYLWVAGESHFKIFVSKIL